MLRLQILGPDSHCWPPPKTGELTLRTPEARTWNQPNAIDLPSIVKEEMIRSVIILPVSETRSLLTGLS